MLRAASVQILTAFTETTGALAPCQQPIDAGPQVTEKDKGRDQCRAFSVLQG